MAKRFFTIKGDNNSNIIPGTNFDDIIYGYGGNDILGAINSNGGDRIYGGDGDDVLYDNTGLGVISPILSDVLDGGKGNDDIFIAGGFLDRFDGGPGDDTFHILPGLLNLFATIDGGGGQDVVVFDIPMPPIQTGAIRHNGANWFFNFDGLFDFHVFRVEEVRFTDYTLDLDGVWAHPIAIDDHFDAQANQPLVIHIDTVLANDIDPDGDGTSFLDFASLNVIDNHDGTLTFDPDGMFDPLPAGETSDVSFEYRITDDRGLLSTGNIRITIHGVNDAPDAQNDLGTTTQNDPVTVAVLGNDTDPDTGDFLTVTDAWLSPDALSTVSFDNTTVTYNPASAYDNLDQGVAEQVELMYTVSDSGGKTDTAAVLITVIGINDQPDAQDDNFLTTQNAPITGNVFEANGSPADFDPDDPLQLTHVNNNPAQVNQWITLSRGGELKIRGDGVLDFNPLSAYVSLARFETVTETATYTITDDNGESDMATVMITVAGLNDQPVARTDTYMLNENATATLLDILANDDDPDLSDALHISTVDTTNTLGKVDWSGNQLTYDPNGQFDYLPVGVTATDRFDYIIADGNGGFNQASVEITITGENDPPRAIPDIGFTDEDTAVTVDVVDNDLDPDGDFLTVTGAQILSGSGTVTHDLANITFTPGAVYNALPAGAHEPVVVAYAVSDGFGGTTTGFVNIDVEGMNDQPIAVPDTGFTTENSAVTLPVIANDSDPDNGDTLRITDARIVSGNGNISYSTEDLLYDPLDNYNHLGTGEKTSIVLAYLVSDNHNAETSTFVTLEITGLNDAPEAFDGIVSLEEDQIIDFDMRDFVHDIDSDNLEIILDTLPAHGVLTLDGLTAIYTP
ncbi:MAG: tandem-95 repeat protein, partial [Burkholderiales bacterium]|nr:tandem-95 repeat protein [Burkholderiales bacterium]